ncbi:MAG: rhomboid family intramembrane serine protease [Pseudomonadota bacterium]
MKDPYRPDDGQPERPDNDPENGHRRGLQRPKQHEPAFNVPSLLLIIVGVLAAIHLFVTMGPDEQAASLFLNMAFFPARLTTSPEVQAAFFYGPQWFGFGTLLTYGLLHGDWLHLGVNALWLITFGAPVVRRLGDARFVLLLAVGVLVGGLTHLVIFWGSVSPLVGISAGVSAIMGGALRFVFDPRDRGMFIALRYPEIVGRRPLQPLRDLWSNPTVLMFAGMVIATNVVFGAVSMPGVADGSSIAWQAHIGGFVAGFLAFPSIDPAAPSAPRSSGDRQ